MWASFHSDNTAYGWDSPLQHPVSDPYTQGFDYFGHDWDWNKPMSDEEREKELERFRFFHFFVMCALGMGSTDPRVLKYERWREEPCVAHEVKWLG